MTTWEYEEAKTTWECAWAMTTWEYEEGGAAGLCSHTPGLSTTDTDRMPNLYHQEPTAARQPWCAGNRQARQWGRRSQVVSSRLLVAPIRL